MDRNNYQLSISFILFDIFNDIKYYLYIVLAGHHEKSIYTVL